MEIPVTFTRHGKEYTGSLKAVAGGGGDMYHLMVNNYYQGALIKTATGWQFSTQKEGVIQELGELFGKVVEEYKKTP